MIEEVTRERSTQEWLEAFEGSGLPYAAVNDVRDTLDHEHVRARDMVVKVEHGACGEVEMVNTPVKYSEAEPGIRTAPPLLGEHTDEVLGEMLGMSAEEIEAMRKEGAVR
jgi:succinate--hydroxymethylglutarate CoA-transferase